MKATDFSLYPGSKTLLGTLLRAPLRAIPRTTVVPIVQGPLRGKKWIVGSGIHRLWLGSYEREKMATAAGLLEPGDTAFDIGANVGIYTLLFSDLVRSSGHVVSFEPLATNVAFLREHLRLNHIDNVTVVQAAVGDKPGTAGFRTTDSSSTGHLEASGDLQVQMTTVDAFVHTSGRLPKLMKIDVEGAELEVLRGAERTIAAARPSILLATHSWQLRAASVHRLLSSGYAVRQVGGSDGTDPDELLAVPSENETPRERDPRTPPG